MLIGAFPPPIGGTTVSLRALDEFLSSRGARVCKVDCSVRSGSQLAVLLRALAATWKSAPHCEVLTLHLSDRATAYAGPLFWAVSRLRRRPLLFRQFGGEFHRTFASLCRLHRWLLSRTVLSADRVLLQTLEQVRALAGYCGVEPLWFPTARSASGLPYVGQFAGGQSSVLECLYVGHVRRLKGVLEAASAVASLPNVRLHVYGPLVDVSAAELLHFGAEYHGVVAPESVPAIMARHDLLVFPTRYPGEGYPGVLVESALSGLPVLATRWQALPEMFPGDEILWLDDGGVDSIVKGLSAVASRQVDLRDLSNRLLERGQAFEANSVFSQFLNACSELAHGGAKSACKG